MADGPIHDVIERWHRFLRGQLEGGLDDLLADDVVFHSPIVFTPQAGKALTRMYLEAAAMALPGDGAPALAEPDAADPTAGADPASGTGDRPTPGRFRYTKQVLDGDTAVLEFETSVEGKYVNGVDIIRCDDTGHIVEFRVMIRPLQAVEAVHAQMRAMLEAMAPGGR